MLKKNIWHVASQAGRKNTKGRHTFKIFPMLIVLWHHQADYWLFLFRMTFFYRTVEESKIIFCSNVWHNINSEIISNYINDNLDKK